MPDTVKKLIAKRKQVMDSFRGEEDFKKLCAIEHKIAAARYETDEDRLAALHMLLEPDDTATFADNFKTDCFTDCRRNMNELVAANDNDRLLTLDEAASQLGICRRTIDRHIASGELPYIIVGQGRIRLRRMIARQDLIDFGNARRRFDIPCQKSTNQPKALSIITTSKSVAFASPALQAALESEKRRHLRSEKRKSAA